MARCVYLAALSDVPPLRHNIEKVGISMPPHGDAKGSIYSASLDGFFVSRILPPPEYNRRHSAYERQHADHDARAAH